MSDEDDDYYYRFFIKHYRRATSGEPYLRSRTKAEQRKINALLDEDPYLMSEEDRIQYGKELDAVYVWMEERRHREFIKESRRKNRIQIKDKNKRARQKTTDRIQSRITSRWLCPTHIPDRVAELYQELEYRNLYIPTAPHKKNRKITPEDVVVIRTLLKRYNFKQVDVAAYYHVDVSIIGTIKRGVLRPDLNPLDA